MTKIETALLHYRQAHQRAFAAIEQLVEEQERLQALLPLHALDFPERRAQALLDAHGRMLTAHQWQHEYVTEGADEAEDLD
jgi:hypothetical protein